MAFMRISTRPRTEVELAFEACRGAFFWIFWLSLFVNLLALTVPIYLLQVYDHVLSSRSFDTLVMLTGIVVLALAVHTALEALRREMLVRIGSWLDERLQPEIITSAVQSALRGEAIAATQAWRDLSSVRTFFGGSSVTGLFDLPWTPIFLIVMMFIHPLLGLIGFAGCAILFLFALMNELITRKPLSRASIAWSNSQHRLEALLRNAEAISAMGMLPGVARLLNADQSEAKEAQRSAGTRGSVIQAVARFFRLLTQVLVMATAAWLVIAKDLSPAAIFACAMLLGRALAPIENSINTWKAVTTVRLGYRRLQKLLSSTPPVVKGMRLPRPNGALSVAQATYVPYGADAPTLRRLSFDLDPGEILAIVGPSGAGKSTLGRLIAGTIRPTAGHVRLDGADISIWLGSESHRYFGYLPQDVELFGGSVKDNIARLQKAEPDEVIAAARLVGLHEIIMRLPQGYDTDIGENGARLSGGQRQRIGLARAFHGAPRLIVLDEPNASLDTEGEEALRVAMQTMRDRGATIIVIAQRFGILNISDKILVLENGAVNAFGSRNDIVAKIKQGRTAIPIRRPVTQPAAANLRVRALEKAYAECVDAVSSGAPTGKLLPATRGLPEPDGSLTTVSAGKKMLAPAFDERSS
jgi:PrtD family type I secretion system ABC transporter